MPNFGKRSQEQRATVTQKLKNIVDSAIKIFDFSFVCGRRSKEDQDEAYNKGYSKVQWPNSKHNTKVPEDLAKAMDLYPHPRPVWTKDLLNDIDSNMLHKSEILKMLKDWARWYYLAGLIKGIAHEQGTDIRQGCNWDSDSDFTDQKFDDIPHHEIT